MTGEERKMIQELHAFWFTPPIMGQPSRAMQIDGVLSLARSSRFSIRIILYFAGGIVAVASGWQTIARVGARLFGGG